MRKVRFTLLSAVLLSNLSIARLAKSDELFPGETRNLLKLEQFASGFDCGSRSCELSSFAFLPDKRLFVTARDGNTFLVSADGTEIVSAGKFVVSDLENEKGLLNVLVHPEFEQTGLLIFYLSRGDQNLVVSVPLAQTGKLELASETQLVSGIIAAANNNGGSLGLSVDKRYLYVGTGDSGCNESVSYYSTCFSNLNGKILRVNLDGSPAADNPLANVAQAMSCDNTCPTGPSGANRCSCEDQRPEVMGPPRQEIWAWGLRNPWRFWVDSKTGHLWVADHGLRAAEELNVIPPEGGKHLGWPFREGLGSPSGNPKTECGKFDPNTGSCMDPVYACTDPARCASITGGAIVDGCHFPEPLRNRYYFGDLWGGRIFSLKVSADRLDVEGERLDVVNTGGDNSGPVHIALGPDGNLYYSTPMDGAIIKVAPKSPIVCEEPVEPAPNSGGTGNSAAGASSGGQAALGNSEGGRAGTNDTTEPRQPGNYDISGCACKTAPRPANTLFAALAGIGAGILLRLRRRKA